MSFSEQPLENYYSGTSGLLLPVPNKEFYPEAFKDKSRLHYYSSLFNSIEINSSFYKMPMASTVAKWAADVPDDFKFTFKLSKEVTHSQNLAFEPRLIREFMKRISEVGKKKAALLIQLPGSIKFAQFPQVERLLAITNAENIDVQWDIFIEFRHQGWYQDLTYEMLERNGIGLVLHDKLSSGGMVSDQSSNSIYLRFHGPSGNYKGSYEEDLLSEYGLYIRDWLNEGKTVYSYFNNTMGSAIANLEFLKRSVY